MKYLQLFIITLLLAIIGFGESFVKVGEDKFVLAYENSDSPQGTIKEFILPGETLDSWTKLVAIREFPKERSAERYIGNMAAEFKKKHPALQFAMFEKKKTREWAIDYLIIEPPPGKSEAVIEWNYFQARKNPSGEGIIVDQFATRYPLTDLTGGKLTPDGVKDQRKAMLSILGQPFQIEDASAP